MVGAKNGSIVTGGGWEVRDLGRKFLRDATRRNAGFCLNIRFICVLLCLDRMLIVEIVPVTRREVCDWGVTSRSDDNILIVDR